MKKHFSKLEEAARDSNVILLMDTYDSRGPDTKTFGKDLKPPHTYWTIPLPTEGFEL